MSIKVGDLYTFVATGEIIEIIDIWEPRNSGIELLKVTAIGDYNSSNLVERSWFENLIKYGVMKMEYSVDEKAEWRRQHAQAEKPKCKHPNKIPYYGCSYKPQGWDCPDCGAQG